MATFNNPRKTAATVTASATLARGFHTPVNATGAAVTMTLPGAAPAGVEVSVEKVDSSANAVTVSGTMRGVTSTIPLTSQYEARTFLSEGNGSWRPISDHRTAASLNAAIAAPPLVADGITYNTDGTVATSTSGGVTTTYTWNSDGTVHTEARLGLTKTWAYDGSGNPTGSTVA